ncbi:hypothetical protein JB92DRAFT_3105141 [Gautieria morchelliformis]|nr:hypothetical protein JB92DRAFT_3105141 [Gautieria morchelliformis]
MAPKQGAANILQAPVDQEHWMIVGWEDALAIVHPDDCDTCMAYAPHLWATTGTRKVKLKDEDIGDTINVAWGWFPRAIVHDARVEPLRDVHELKKEVKDLGRAVEDHDDALEAKCAKVKELEEQLNALQLTHAASKRPCHDLATDPVAGHSSPCATAPLSARAALGLASQISAPTPTSMEGQSTPSNAAYDILDGWESDSSIWKTYDADRAQHIGEQLKKKHKKLYGTPNTYNGLAIARESVISAYLAVSPSHTINDPALQRQVAASSTRNPKWDCFVIASSTLFDIVAILKGWIHNPEGIPSAIRDNADGTLSLADMDVWMWLKALAPRVKGVASPLKSRLFDLFSSMDQCPRFIDARECLIPQSTSLRLSITGPYPMRGWTGPDILLAEIAWWLAHYAGVTCERVACIEHYVQGSLTGAAFSAAT